MCNPAAVIHCDTDVQYLLSDFISVDYRVLVELPGNCLLFKETVQALYCQNPCDKCL